MERSHATTLDRRSPSVVIRAVLRIVTVASGLVRGRRGFRVETDSPGVEPGLCRAARMSPLAAGLFCVDGDMPGEYHARTACQPLTPPVPVVS